MDAERELKRSRSLSRNRRRSVDVGNISFSHLINCMIISRTVGMAYDGIRFWAACTLMGTSGEIGYQPYRHIPGHASMIYELNVIHDSFLSCFAIL